jgi:hypothetical protein
VDESDGEREKVSRDEFCECSPFFFFVAFTVYLHTKKVSNKKTDNKMQLDYPPNV